MRSMNSGFNWATVIAAIIAAVMSLLNIFSNFTFHREQMKQTNSIEQKKIAADVTAQARIAWIQQVREATVNVNSSFRKLFIAEYISPKRDRYDKDLEVALTNYRYALSMLILFFGPDQRDQRDQNIPDLSNDANEACFDIKKEFEEIASPNDLTAFDQEELSDIRSKVKEEREKIKKIERENKTNLSKLLTPVRENNKGLNNLVISYLNSLYETSYDIRFGDNKDTKYQYSAMWMHNTKVIEGYVEKLVPIISIYLKVEWDRAKKGE